MQKIFIINLNYFQEHFDPHASEDDYYSSATIIANMRKHLENKLYIPEFHTEHYRIKGEGIALFNLISINRENNNVWYEFTGTAN